jgi:predicted metalloprotease with PDZ domain
MTAALALALAAQLAQAPQRDTLAYHVALTLTGRSVSVEARHTNATGAPLTLVAPPAAARAGTTVAGIGATDDRGVPLPLTRSGRTYRVEPRGPGPIRFRYRLTIRDRVAQGSTGAGFDSTRFYAVSAGIFVAPDPTALRKSGTPYPLVRIGVIAPQGWHVVTGFSRLGDQYLPEGGDELIGATVAAAPDFRVYRDSAPGAAFTVAIRGRRYFADSALTAVVRASLHKSTEALGPPPVARITYTSDMGRKGRTSGSLQGTGSIGLMWEPGELLERARTHDTFHETLHLWFGGAMETERWWTEGVTDYFAARLYAAWHGDPAELAALCFESYYHYLNIDHRTRLTMAQETRQAMGGDNTELLAYRKGMLAGLLLDAAIRRSTGGRASLDSVARRALDLARDRRSRAVREAELRDAVREIGGGAAGRVWDQVVAGTEPLQLNEIAAALQAVTGRSFAAPERPKRRKTFDHARGG